MSLFSFASWIAEERKRAKAEMDEANVLWHRKGCSWNHWEALRERYLGQLCILRRLSARLRRGR